MEALIVIEEIRAGGGPRVFSHGVTLILVLEKEWRLAQLIIVRFQEVSWRHARFKTFLSMTIGKWFLFHHNFRESVLSELLGTCWWNTLFYWISTRVNSDCRLMCDRMDRNSQFFKIFWGWNITLVDNLANRSDIW